MTAGDVTPFMGEDEVARIGWRVRERRVRHDPEPPHAGAAGDLTEPRERMRQNNQARPHEATPGRRQPRPDRLELATQIRICRVAQPCHGRTTMSRVTMTLKR